MLQFNSFACFKYSKTIETLQIKSSILTDKCFGAILEYIPQLVDLRLAIVRMIDKRDDCVLPITHLKHLKCFCLSTPKLAFKSFILFIEFCTNTVVPRYNLPQGTIKFSKL